MDNKVLTIGCDLNGRTITSAIPDTTTISELKYIAKVNDDTYIAENLMAVDGQTGNCSCVYYHYLDENSDPVTQIFYLKNSSEVVTNLTSFTLPEDFGVVTEIDNTAVVYDYLTRSCHEKVYVMCEDFCKEESMTKGQIEEHVEDEVAGYCVPTDSVIGWSDDLPIPDGYEETDETFGGGESIPVGSEFDYDGETIPDGYEEVNDPSVYSITEEKVIGTWINGKPIYRKTINFGTLPNATTKTVAHNILNVDEILKYYGKALSTSGNSFVLPYPAVVSSETMAMYVNSTDIGIVTGIDRSSLTTYVTLEYTKTTDTVS